MTKELQIKRFLTAGGEPADGYLKEGEIIVNPVDKKLWVGDSSGNPVWLNSPATAALGYAELGYRITLPVTAAPASKHISRDNNDPTLTTILYFNKIDDSGADIGLYLEEMKAGQWINIHRKTDTTRFEKYDIVGAPTLAGDVYAVPVAFFSQAGTALADGNRVRAFWRVNQAIGYDTTYQADVAAMLAQTGMRVGDVTVTNDDKVVYKLSELPSNAVANWEVIGRQDYDFGVEPNPVQTHQMRRGLEVELTPVVLASGEPAWDTDRKVLRIGDGTTAGGIDIGRPALKSTIYTTVAKHYSISKK